MLNEQKIKMMTKLAIYENNIGKEDLEINEYYRRDFILIKNIKTRIAISIACLILFGSHALIEFFMDLTVINNLMGLGIIYLILYAVLLIVYSLISTRIYAKRYEEAQARLSGYKKVLARINKFNEEL
jgi:hypothetical protein